MVLMKKILAPIIWSVDQSFKTLNYIVLGKKDIIGKSLFKLHYVLIFNKLAKLSDGPMFSLHVIVFHIVSMNINTRNNNILCLPCETRIFRECMTREHRGNSSWWHQLDLQCSPKSTIRTMAQLLCNSMIKFSMNKCYFFHRRNLKQDFFSLA